MAVARPKKPSELPSGIVMFPQMMTINEMRRMNGLEEIPDSGMVIMPAGVKYTPIGTAAEPERCAYCGTRVIGTVVNCQGCGAPV